MKVLDARRFLRDIPVAHVASSRPVGSPHVVPLWLIWRDEAIYISCRRGSATWRNVEHDPRLSLSLSTGRRWQEYAGATIRGRADPLITEHPALRGVMSDWFQKYRPLLAGGGFRDYAEQVEQPGMLRVRIAEISLWNHAVPGQIERLG